MSSRVAGSLTGDIEVLSEHRSNPRRVRTISPRTGDGTGTEIYVRGSTTRFACVFLRVSAKVRIVGLSSESVNTPAVIGVPP